MNLRDTINLLAGGKGSGDHGHSGRPGEKGGSGVGKEDNILGDKPLYTRRCLEVGFSKSTLTKVPVKIIRVSKIKPEDGEPGGIVGSYNRNTDTITMGKDAGWKDVMHEIGHHLDATIFDGIFTDEMADHYSFQEEQENKGKQPFIGRLAKYAFTNMKEFTAETFKEFTTDNETFKGAYPRIYKTYKDVIKRLNNNEGVYSKRDTDRNKNEIKAGGPGSGCNGPNCGRPSTLHQALNPRDPRAIKVAEKAKALLRTQKIDPRLFKDKDKQMSSFVKAPTSARGKETVAWYAPHQRSLTLYPGGNHHDVVHEMGHLLDYAWLKKSAQDRESKRIDTDKVKELMKDIGKEYNQLRQQKIGDQDPTKVWNKISNKGVPSAYALYNKEEWLAESFHQYFKDNDRLKRVAPKTYNALKTILEGKIFR